MSLFCFFVLSRARYPSSHVCTSSAVFIGFMYILKVWSFIHLLTPPSRWVSGFKTRICHPYPHVTGKGRLEWGGFSELSRKKVDPVLVLCFFIFILFACFVVVVVAAFFFAW